MPNALLDETKSDRIEFGIDWLRELKVQPSVKALLLEVKPSNMGWGDFAIFSMLAFAFISATMRFDLRGVIRLGVRLVGAVPDDRAPDPTLVGSPDKKPGAKAAGR